MTLPTPAIAPSEMKLARAPSGSVLATIALTAAVPLSIVSITGLAQAKTAWKTIAMTTNRPIVPGTGRLINCANLEPKVAMTGVV